MRILYITTDENRHLNAPDRAQGDYIENTILIGLRKLLGENCVDYPRKRILYHDFSSVARSSLHGAGFSLYHEPMQDIPDECRNLSGKEFDFIIYGTAFAWGMMDLPALEQKCRKKFYIDGHDMYGVATCGKYITHDGETVIGNQVSPAFKGQLIVQEPDVFPTGVGLPESRILPLDLSKKVKLFQTAYPRYAYYEQPNEANRAHYVYSDEEAYYADMASSWFGLTCKRGGWDAMRHYEIIAAGSLLLFRDYANKPKYCAPGSCPAIAYTSKEELHRIMNELVVDNKPTEKYLDILYAQRRWLMCNATTESRAAYVLKVLETYL